MTFVYKWILPIAFVAIGVAIFFGLLLPQIPAGTGLRPMVGVVCVLLGIHRYAASRARQNTPRRRYGGYRNRPWEED